MIDFQAVVFAAGKGSRLTELGSGEEFKCNLQVANLPMLFYPLRNLKNAGFTEVIVIVPLNYKQDMNLGKQLNLSVDYVSVDVDTEEQGTAESLRLIKEKINSSKNLLLVSCDLITDIDLSDVCMKHRVSDSRLTSLLTPLPAQLHQSPVPGKPSGPKSQYKPERDIIAIETKTNRLLQFGAAADYEETVPFRHKLIRHFPNMQVFSDLLDCHVYALHPQAVEFILHSANLATVKGEVLPKLIQAQFSIKGLKGEDRPPEENMDTYKCYAVMSNCFAVRTNTVQAYKIANGEVRNIFNDLFPASEENNIVKGRPAIGSKSMVKKNVLGANCVIGSGCKVVSSILYDGVRVEDGATVQNSIMCRGSVVEKGAQVVNSLVGMKNVVPEGTKITNEVVGASKMEFE